MKKTRNTLKKSHIKTVLMTSFLLSWGGSATYAEIIKRIEVTGNKRIDPQAILSLISSLKEGQQYTQENLDEATRELYETGRFSDVVIKAQGPIISIAVSENLVINRVVFEGNRIIKDEMLSEECQIKPRHSLSTEVVHGAQQRILELYRRMGRYAVVVKPQMIRLPNGRVDLVFEINEGEKTQIQKIVFIGNKALSSSRLEKALLTKRAKWYRFFANDDTYDPERFMADQHEVQKYYYNNGYPDYRLISATAEMSLDGKSVTLVLNLKEGDLYTFGQIKTTSSLPKVSIEEVASKMLISRGETFSQAALEKSVLEMTDHLKYQGLSFAEVHPTITKNQQTKTVDVTFDLRQGRRAYVERIDIQGNDRTHDEVIRREISLHEGDAYNSVYLKQSERNLTDLGYFKKVEMITEPGSASDKVKIIVKVEEQPTGELGFSLGFSSVDKALGNIHFGERNFMGTGRRISASTTLALRRQEFSLSFAQPYLFGYKMEGGADVFHTRSSQMSQFKQQSTGGRLNFFYSLAENWYQNLSYGLRQDRVYDAQSYSSLYIREQTGRFIDSSIAQTLIYDRRNSRLDPTAGYNISLNNSYSGVGGNVKYLSNRLRGSTYYTVWEDVVLNGRLTIGNVMRVSSQKVRLVDCVFLGAETFRGFAYGGLGPRDAQTKDALGGTKYWVGTLEAQFPIGLPNEFGIKGSAFTDFGSVWGLSQTFPNLQTNDSKAMRASVGAALSWASPFGPLRLTFAVPVKKKPYDDPQRILIGTTTTF